VTSFGACGDGVGDGGVVGDVEEPGELLCEGLPVPVGDATVPPSSGNPFARTTAPATTSATMTTIRAVPRFTAASYPLALSRRPRPLQPDAEAICRSAAPPDLPDPAQPPNQHR